MPRTLCLARLVTAWTPRAVSSGDVVEAAHPVAEELPRSGPWDVGPWCYAEHFTDIRMLILIIVLMLAFALLATVALIGRHVVVAVPEEGGAYVAPDTDLSSSRDGALDCPG